MSERSLLRGVSRRLGITQMACRQLLDALSEEIAIELLSDGMVSFTNVGRLKIKHYAARMGVNPKTREPVQVPAKRKVIFTPSEEMAKRLKS
jgi:DNA-binding protein HU-beta